MTSIKDVTDKMLVDLIKRLVVIRNRTPEQQLALTNAQTMLTLRREEAHRAGLWVAEAERD